MIESIDLPASAEPHVSILVVLTADAPRAAQCLQAIAAGAGATASEVVLVLNGATPDVCALVDERVRGARVIDATVDLGVPAAWRQGLALARAPRVALLHEDSTPRPGWLRPLVATLDARPHAGVAGSRLLFPDGSHQNDGWVLWRDGHVSVVSGELAQPADATARAVDYVSSASLLADRALLERLDLPDERWFPAVYTDTDLSRAVWAAARTVVHVPQSVVLHGTRAMVQRAGPAARGPRLPEYLYERNRERFVAKWRQELAARPERPSGVYPDAIEPTAMRAALAITEARAARIEAGPAPGGSDAARPHGPDRVTVGSEPVARATAARRELEEGFTAWLARRLEQALTDVDVLTQAREAERAGALAHHAALQAEVDRAVAANVALTEQLRRLAG